MIAAAFMKFVSSSDVTVLALLICSNKKTASSSAEEGSGDESTKIDSSFLTAQFRLANYHTPYCLGISDKSGGILVYIKSNIPTFQLNCGNLCKSIQAAPFEINLRKEK